MSVYSGERPLTWRRPRPAKLLGATLAAQLTTGLALWVLDIPLAIGRLAPVSSSTNPFLSWTIVGPWSLLGAAGFCTLVSALGGAILAQGITARGLGRPSAGWAALAFGVSGYGALLLGDTGAACVLLAVVLAPLCVRALAYRLDGSTRPWPDRLSFGRRGRLAVLFGALVLTLAYSIPHAFAADGSGSGPDVVAPAHAQQFMVELGSVWPSATIERVTLDGPAARRVSLISTTVALDEMGPATRSTPLPFHVASGHSTWLTLVVAPRACRQSTTRIDAVTVMYRTLGIATREHVVLQSPIALACRAR